MPSFDPSLKRDASHDLSFLDSDKDVSGEDEEKWPFFDIFFSQVEDSGG